MVYTTATSHLSKLEQFACTPNFIFQQLHWPNLQFFLKKSIQRYIEIILKSAGMRQIFTPASPFSKSFPKCVALWEHDWQMPYAILCFQQLDIILTFTSIFITVSYNIWEFHLEKHGCVRKENIVGLDTKDPCELLISLTISVNLFPPLPKPTDQFHCRSLSEISLRCFLS